MADEIVLLWPDGVSTGDVGPELEFSGLPGLAKNTRMLRNVSQPTLTVHRPTVKSNGASVIVCPGGGWRILFWEHEGVDVANWFAARGYTAFLLKYRLMGTPGDHQAFLASMPKEESPDAPRRPASEAPRSMRELLGGGRWTQGREIAAEDGRRAVALAREQAKKWDLDPGKVGMIGFSVGALLVTDVAMDPRAAPLAFIAPIYGGETEGRPVPKDAPPLFTVIAQDDWAIFRVVETLHADWTDADRPSELHVFARGRHGFGMIRQGMPIDRWTDLLEAWLVDLRLT